MIKEVGHLAEELRKWSPAHDGGNAFEITSDWCIYQGWSTIRMERSRLLISKEYQAL